MIKAPNYSYRFFLDAEHFEDVMFEWSTSRKGCLHIEQREVSPGLDFCKENIDLRLIGA